MPFLECQYGFEPIYEVSNSQVDFGSFLRNAVLIMIASTGSCNDSFI